MSRQIIGTRGEPITITAKYTQYSKPIPKGKLLRCRLAHLQPPSSEMLSFAVNSDSLKDPKLVKVQKTRECGMLRSKWDIDITLLLPELRRRGGQSV